MQAATLFRIYYLGTPVFMLADYLLGFPMRAAAIEDASLRLLYYLFCIGCGAVCYLAPTRAALLTLIESSLSIFLLIYAVMAPIFGVYETMLVSGEAPEIMPPARLINFMISGGILAFSFHWTVEALRSGD